MPCGRASKRPSVLFRLYWRVLWAISWFGVCWCQVLAVVEQKNSMTYHFPCSVVIKTIISHRNSWYDLQKNHPSSLKNPNICLIFHRPSIPSLYTPEVEHVYPLIFNGTFFWKLRKACLSSHQQSPAAAMCSFQWGYMFSVYLTRILGRPHPSYTVAIFPVTHPTHSMYKVYLPIKRHNMHHSCR